MENRITVAEFLELCKSAGKVKMSSATLNRKLTDQSFIDQLGAEKMKTKTSKIPAWTFDLGKAQTYAAGETSTALVKPDHKPTFTKAEPKPETPSTDKQKNPQSSDDLKMMQNVLMLPHKLVTNLKETNLLTGVPSDFLKDYGVLTASGYKFNKEMREKAASEYLIKMVVPKKPFNKKDEPKAEKATSKKKKNVA